MELEIACGWMDAAMGIEYRNAKGRAKKRRYKREAEERAWAAKAGPVTIRQVDTPIPAESEKEAPATP